MPLIICGYYIPGWRSVNQVDKSLVQGQQSVIYQATNHCQQEFILILWHIKIKNMTESFIVYIDSTIFNMALDFLVTLV